jgi:hypothetical protein
VAKGTRLIAFHLPVPLFFLQLLFVNLFVLTFLLINEKQARLSFRQKKKFSTVVLTLLPRMQSTEVLIWCQHHDGTQLLWRLQCNFSQSREEVPDLVSTNF